MIKAILILFALFISFSNSYSGQSESAAFDRLRKVDTFAFGGVGFAGRTSQGEKDFRTILKGQKPRAALKHLYETGTIAAKCYALVGLKEIDQKEFEILLRKIENEGGKVTTMRGCLMRREPLSQVIIEIQKGGYSRFLDVDYPRQSNEQTDER